MKKALITNYAFRDIGGSEMTALEVAEELSLRGWEVWIYSHLAGGLMASAASVLKNVHVVLDPYEDIPEDLDLIWIHHTTLPDNIIDLLAKKSTNIKVVWLHMSIWVHMEMPMFPEIEYALADDIFAISELVGDSISKFGIDKEDLKYFRNPAPRKYFMHINKKSSKQLRSLLAVSNHLTKEQKEAITTLRNTGIDVHVTGVADKPEVVLPDLLAKFDAIMTIGKTVQYAFVQGLPVYLYDHNGGPGWLSSIEQINNLEKNHFRGTTYPDNKVIDKASDDIVNEIIHGYDKAREFMCGNSINISNRYNLEYQIDNILNSPCKIKKLTLEQAEILKNYNELFRGLFRTLEYEKLQPAKCK